MPVSFSDCLFLIYLRSYGPIHNVNIVTAKPHRSTEILDLLLLWQEINYRVHGAGVKLSGVCIYQTKNVPCKCDNGHLETKAKSKIGYCTLSCIICDQYLALASSLAKSLRNQNPMIAVKLRESRRILLKLLRINPVNLHRRFELSTGMGKSFIHRSVAVDERDIFPYHCDFDFFSRLDELICNLLPS